jgi:hypothetical protein
MIDYLAWVDRRVDMAWDQGCLYCPNATSDMRQEQRMEGLGEGLGAALWIPVEMKVAGLACSLARPDVEHRNAAKDLGMKHLLQGHSHQLLTRDVYHHLDRKMAYPSTLGAMGW